MPLNLTPAHLSALAEGEARNFVDGVRRDLIKADPTLDRISTFTIVYGMRIEQRGRSAFNKAITSSSSSKSRRIRRASTTSLRHGLG